MTQNIDVGGVLSRTFEAYRDQFTLLFPAALAIFVPIAIVNGIVLNSGGALALLIPAILGLVGGFLYQGMVVRAAEDILDGRRDETVGSLISGALPVLGPLIGAGLLAGIAIFQVIILVSAALPVMRELRK
jgi:hypothetical protein